MQKIGLTDREVLEAIALHFEGCDISGSSPADESCQWVVRQVTKHLGWYVLKTQDNEIKYHRASDGPLP